MCVIIFTACAQQKKATSNATTDTKAKKTSKIERLSMRRTPCFGTCPSYSITLTKDGKATFKSQAFTEYEGTYEKTFAPADINKLFLQFEEFKVDTCSTEYESLIQDVPGVFYNIGYKGGEDQEISNAHFGPGFLVQLSMEVDSFSKVDDSWTKVAEAEKR